MQFAPKHVVTMVACVSAAVILAPVAVMAATGVTITDAFDPSRSARVTKRGTLWVESRAGVASDSFHVLKETVTTVGGHVVKETTSRVAVTSWVVTVHGDNSASTNHFRLYYRTRTSGTAGCASGSGWSPAVSLATMAVHAGSTEQLLWNGPPLVVPVAAGTRICLGLQQTKWTGATDSDMQVTGYTFT